MRSYAKRQERTTCCCSLVEIVQKAVAAAGKPPVRWGEMPEAFVRADPFELEFVCSNFVKNAVDAVKNVTDPVIRIEIISQEESWALAVTDNGPALSDEVFGSLGKITTSSKTDGLGFGLAIASGIAEANSGHLEFERMRPQGLKAIIVLRKCMPANEDCVGKQS